MSQIFRITHPRLVYTGPCKIGTIKLSAHGSNSTAQVLDDITAGGSVIVADLKAAAGGNDFTRYRGGHCGTGIYAKTVTGAAATVTGSQVENFNIGATSNKVSLTVTTDTTSATTVVTLTQGAARTAAQVSGEIDTAVAGLTVDTSTGAVRITHDTTGVGATFTINAITNDAYTVLGLTAATTAGTGAKLFIELV